MANQEHLEVLKQGTAIWNEWRKQHPEVQYPDLSETDLRGANLSYTFLNGANLNGANLNGANLNGANLIETTFSRANLSETDLRGADSHGTFLREKANLSRANLSLADLSRADLSRADLSGADLSRATLYEATLSEADLSGADLRFTTLVGTKLIGATLTECHIYGISAWDVELTGTLQNSLVITPPDEPTITVDNLKIAQFIYLLLNNQEIRDVIDTIAKKAVLILGRFTPERKAVLDALRDELRRCGYLPILFDFKKPSTRNLTETVSTLAHLSRFIIADLTDPRSIPNELRAIIPILRVPIQPLLHILEEPYGMFDDFQDYPWVLPTYRYTDLDSLLATLEEQVIDPAERKAQELTKPS